MAPDVSPTLAAQHRAAQRHLRRGEFLLAITILSSLLSEVDVPAAAYEDWVKTLLLAVRHAGPASLSTLLSDESRRQAGAQLQRLQAICHIYLGSDADRGSAAGLLGAAQFPVERALFLTAGATNASVEQLSAAGDLLKQAGRLVRAASAYAAAGQRDAAIACYQALLASPAGAKNGAAEPTSRLPWTDYEQALTHFQLTVLLSLAGRGADEIQRHSVAAQSLLEQLADEHEAADQPERAIDVYCVYIALGRATARFENIAEGFVGCLRLLKQERLITAALRCYEDFLACCVQWGEFLLAGQQARDAADFLDHCSLPWGDRYRRRAAEFFAQAGADERRESAYRESLLQQAVALYSGLSDHDAARRILLQLAELPATPRASAVPSTTPDRASDRAARYRRLASLYPAPAVISEGDAAERRAVTASETEPSELPAEIADRTGELPVWDLDLCEWEDAGDPHLIAFAILCDRGRPLLSRRQALRVLMLHDLAPPAPASLDAIQARLQLVDAVAGLRCYEALRPLEELFYAARPVGPIAISAAAPDGEWRATVLRRPQTLATAPDLFADDLLPALRRQLIERLPRLHFRRSLAMVVRGLTDPDLAVFAASLQALSQGRYIGSVGLLSRILDGSEPSLAAVPPISRLDVKRAALVALSRVRELRAYQLILDAYRREGEPLRGDAFALLRYGLSSDSNTLRPLLLRAVQVGGAELAALRGLVGD